MTLFAPSCSMLTVGKPSWHNRLTQWAQLNSEMAVSWLEEQSHTASSLLNRFK